MTIQGVSFERFCSDKRLINEPISSAWEVAYKALDGEPVSKAELPLWRAMSGRDTYAPADYRALVPVKGRRSGGTKTACKYLCYKIHTSDFREFVPKGERVHVVIILQTRPIAREVKRYFDGFYANSSLLGREVEMNLKDSIVLRSGVVISCQTCSYRAPRGITVPLGLGDEIGVWRQEGSEVDREVIRSLTPAMIQFPSRKLILLGTPWVRAGVLFEAWERRFEPGDQLVLHCPTALMNPLIQREDLEKERGADPQNFAREFEATWTSDLEQFLNDADLVSAVVGGRTELQPQPGIEYAGAIDASGLTGGDRFVFGVGHESNGRSIVDCLRGWRSTPVAQVIDEITGLSKAYRIRKIAADQYSFTFIGELFRQRGIEVEQLAFSARNKPEIFLHMKLRFGQGKIEMIQHAEVLRELRSLESTRLSGGGYRIAEPGGAHDDYACCLAILIRSISQPARQPWVEVLTPGRSTSHVANRCANLGPKDSGSETWWRRLN